MKSNPHPKSLHVTLAAVAAVVFVLTVLADTAPPPVLSIASAGTNVLITITNGVSYTNYQIVRVPILNDRAYPWVFSALGTNGQTNFLIGIGTDTQSYFRALVGSDQDTDGVPDWMDADPYNASIGVLTITIDSPTSGMTFN